jgi:molybdate transport system substrate-binding protein
MNLHHLSAPHRRPARLRTSSVRRAAPLVMLALGLTLTGGSAAPSAWPEGDPAPARPLLVAVAANFAPCLDELGALYEAETGVPVHASSASTGVHFAQIVGGAPFDVFLAADARRPRLLAERGLVRGDVVFTYAFGRLVLWRPDGQGGVRRACPADSLRQIITDILADDARPLAVAADVHAPYGVAARQALAALELQDLAAERLVSGMSVGQTWQHVATGAAAAGFVAASQIAGAGRADPGWRAGMAVDVPAELYEPLVQQAALLASSPQPEAAAQFLRFLRSVPARDVIAAYGYTLPGAAP